MDRIPDLSALQGVMLSADNHYSFAKLKDKGGNEEKIKYVIEQLSNYLKEKNYITENGVVEENCVEYEKLSLYLWLNADLPVLEDMTELPGLGARVWTLPTLPGALLSELVWALHMRRFLHRVIAFSAPRLALQVGEALVAGLQYWEPTRDPERPALLGRALYRLLCRLHFARPAASPAGAPTVAAALLRACLARLAHAPTHERALELSTDDQHILLARTLSAALFVLDDCLARFTTVEQFEDDEFTDIYLATHQPDGFAPETTDFKMCDSPDREISESLRECNSCLLDACAALVMRVSVDAFCAWSEHEEDGRSVQRAVGELCYTVRARLQTTPLVADHALAGMLAPLARRPVEAADLIDDADEDTIAERIRARDADSAAWLAALLRRRDLCRQPALLRLLEAEADTLDEDQSSRLFDRIVDHLPDEDGNGPVLKSLAIRAFRRCADSTQDRILAERFREYFADDLQTAEFHDASVATFNRLTGEGGGGAPPGDVLALFLQNPAWTLRTALEVAGDGPAQAELVARVVERLGPGRARRYPGEAEPTLGRVARRALDEADGLADERRRRTLARFLAGLARRGLLPREWLLLRVALPRLHAALSGGAGEAWRARSLETAVRLLRAAALPAPPAPRAALLAVLAQALDATRDPPAPAEPDVRDRLLRLQADMLDAYHEHLSDAELRWLRDRLQRATPLTRCHYARLWGRGAPGAPPTLAAVIRDQPVDALLLAPREWDELLPRGAGNEALARARAALLAATRAALRSRTPAAGVCLQRAHAAAMPRVKNNYLSSPPTEAQALTALQLVLTVAGGERGLAQLWAPLLGHLAAARAPHRPALAARLRAAAEGGAVGACYLRDYVQYDLFSPLASAEL